MSILSEISRFFSEFSEVPTLAKQDNVIRYVPSNARYVTVGAAIVLKNGEAFAEKYPAGVGINFMSNTEGIAVPGYSQHIYYLVHDGSQVSIIRPAGPNYSKAIAAITSMTAYVGGGFLLVFNDGTGLLVKAQTPVQIPPDAMFRTIRGVTNAQYGWDKEFSQYGITMQVYETGLFGRR